MEFGLKLNFLYSAVENLLQHGLPERFNNGLQDRFERMSIISSHIFNDLSNGRDPLSGDHEYIARELLGGEYLNDNSEEHDAGVNIDESRSFTHEDSRYVIVEADSWSAAEAEAQKLGGHLVSINSRQEQAAIKSFFANSLNPLWRRVGIWIGLHRDPDWGWSSGEASTPWAISRINNGGTLWRDGEDEEFVNALNEAYIEAATYQKFWGFNPWFGEWRNEERPIQYGLAEISLNANNNQLNANNNQPKTDETTKFVASLVEQAADMSQSLWQKLDRRLEHSESDSALDFVSEILPVKRQYFDELNLLSTNISLISESFKSEIASKNAMFSLREGEFFDGSPKHDFLAHFNREGNQPEVFGKEGDDVLLGSTGSDALFGNSGSDIVIGGPKSDKLFGGVGDDDLKGDEGKDFLFGGPGNDQLDGGMSDDNLSGGSGQDTFVYNGGHDVIRDFSFRRPNPVSEDIDILKTNFDLDDDSIEIERPPNTGNTVLLTFDDNNSLKFANIPLAIFNQDDFISTLKDHLA